MDRPVLFGQAIYPVIQTKLHTDEQNGNCLRACIATLTGLDIDSMPHFEDMGADEWQEPLYAWLYEHGFEPWCHYAKDGPAPAGYSMACGDGPRGLKHCVVVLDGELAFDPHPRGGGLLSQDWWLTLTSGHGQGGE